VGIRPGEKLHEEMISENDARRAVEFDDHYVIVPPHEGWQTPASHQRGRPVPEGFVYRSDTNDRWLEIEEIRRLADVESHE